MNYFLLIGHHKTSGFTLKMDVCCACPLNAAMMSESEVVAWQKQRQKPQKMTKSRGFARLRLWISQK
ncbi:hypothetical protein [Rhodoferax sp. BLA1]|uniref:hypothetical protein n=1 Tax=Rhodoferax sp. BLA1 TaxID=2576062 RepID=UPI0015D108A7|nr:hypothetical protein [Rhodoferax sp. BLA1]